jgi:hypothetical protein
VDDALLTQDSRRMSAEDTARRGMQHAVKELEQRGANVRRATTTRSRNTLRVRLPRGDHVDVYVKTRGSGTWQTDIRKGTPTPESPDVGCIRRPDGEDRRVLRKLAGGIGRNRLGEAEGGARGIRPVS